MVSIIKKLFDLNDEYEITPIEEHEGGRNWVFTCKYMNQPKYVIRVSNIGDRKEKEYWAEVEFVHFLAKGGTSVADVIWDHNDILSVTYLGKYLYQGYCYMVFNIRANILYERCFKRS